MRKFDNNAVRDVDNGKIKYYGFQHPLCDYSFGKYMLKHQKQANGEMRDADNWWGTWDTKVSLECMTRHLEDLKLIKAGYFVYKARTDIDGKPAEKTYVRSKRGLEVDKNWEEVTEEDACNAIRFNADAYKLRLFKEKCITGNH